MQTYTTLDGRVLDLHALAQEDRAFFERAYRAYQDDLGWAEFSATYVNGPTNPLLHATNGWVTRQVWDHPLFQALHDLGDRLGIRQGMLAPEGDYDADPLADEWIPTSEAARRKGVTLPGLHKAIARGDVLARPEKPAGVRLLVSLRSLDHWHPNPVRQAARRRAPAAHRAAS